ncbi:flavodoxin [Egibacter rhizosphaerae]|uniref:Flavodoxin n=1 Tax=Egibacter rhizosphaerae TaxID=1670831 RepID=A0A411YFW9_9ACTN|nr:flavodoxin domain-containing protein [Egibacter rhizosphaerae]QBI20086.1 flavodoxin [Egibacter rhizosphaerae]
MSVLVVFESMYGNTEAIARGIAAGLADRAAVRIQEVGAAPAAIPDDVELLVVGGPTHAFGMSRESTRRDAAQRTSEALVSPGIGVREWLDALPKLSREVAATAFDTRIAKPRVPGSAARGADRRLRALGFRRIAPRSFYVGDTTGPLSEGEVERARQWGQRLAQELTSGGPRQRIG